MFTRSCKSCGKILDTFDYHYCKECLVHIPDIKMLPVEFITTDNTAGKPILLNSKTLKVKKLHEDAIIPSFQSTGASCFDLHALEDYEIANGSTQLIRTGLSFEIPKGYELQIRSRSGIALKTKLRIANGIGTIDSDYTGEVKIIMDNIATNFSYEKITKGMRIAQAAFVKVEQPTIEEVTDIKETERGSGGFGSTGV